MAGARSEAKSAALASGEQLLRSPAHELSQLIKQGRLTSTTLCRAYIEKIKQVQPIVNAVCEDRFEGALQEAAAIDKLVARHLASESSSGGHLPVPFTEAETELLESALLGVPVSVKECIAVAGMKNSCGLWDRRDTLAQGDAVAVRNARRHGLIPICTTNVPEMTMFWADCRNKIYGTTYNPYDAKRVPGASSGGEGALIGAGASIIGIGTDIGGSLRNPAHYSGIMSHKPSPFLVSAEGNYPPVKEARLRMFTIGPMARYASDLRHLLAILLRDKDNPKQDSYLIHQPEGIADTRKRIIRQLGEPFDLRQVKFFYGQFSEMNKLRALINQREPRVEPAITQAQQDVLNHFGSKFNCQAQQIDLEKYLAEAYTAWTCMMFCGGVVDRDQAFDEREAEKIFGITNLNAEVLKFILGMSKHTRESVGIILFGLPMPKNRSKAYKLCEKYEQWISDAKQELETILGPHGCVVMPTLPSLAHKHNQAMMRTNEARFPWLWNVFQFPVTHVTVGLDKVHGLPFGLTIASRTGNDALTIAVAEEIEKALGGWTPPSKF